MSSNLSRTSEYLYDEEEQLTNDDVSLRHEFAAAVDSLCNAFKEKSLGDCLLDDIKFNRITPEEIMAVAFTKKQKEQYESGNMTRLKIDFYKELLKDNWNHLSAKTKNRSHLLFEKIGEKIFTEDEFHYEDYRKSIIKVNKNPICSKYKLPNDSYYYDFFAVNDQAVNFEDELCLSIGSCTFFPFTQVESFPYIAYSNHLQKYFNIANRAGLLFSPNSQSKEEVNMVDVIDAPWDYGNLITTEDRTNHLLVWKNLTKYAHPIKPQVFRDRYLQSLKVQRLTGGNYCILTFGQFQQLNCFFMKMVMQKGTQWRPLKRFKKYISMAFFDCKHSNRRKETASETTEQNKDDAEDDEEEGEGGKNIYFDDCTKNIIVLLDTLHRIVILGFDGEHSERCTPQNKLSGYCAFRNLALHKRDLGTQAIMNKIHSEYTECFNDVILELGYPPDSNNLGNWKKFLYGQTKRDYGKER